MIKLFILIFAKKINEYFKILMIWQKRVEKT